MPASFAARLLASTSIDAGLVRQNVDRARKRARLAGLSMQGRQHGKSYAREFLIDKTARLDKRKPRT